MIEQEQARRLPWEGCLNARDLGGYRTRDGHETRWGAIVRSDNPSTLTDAGKAALVDHGVRTIVDLRTPSEVTEYPNPFAESGSHGIAYHHLSLVDPAGSPAPEFTTLANDYKSMLDRFPDQVGAIMRTIADAPKGGVMIHCMAGKDRTGIMSALLLDLAGVPRETIGEDYALTAEYLRPRDEEWLENGPGNRADRERLLARVVPSAAVMTEVLAYLDERYGGVEGYLQQAGVASEQIAQIRERLLSTG